jgi:HEAT repeat protein
MDLVPERNISYDLAALNGAELEVKFDIIGDLIALGDKRAIEPLLRILRNKESNDMLQQTAGLALGYLKPRAVPSLIHKLNDTSEEPYVRAWIAEALGAIGDMRAIPPLMRALRDSSSAVRERTADALGRFGSPKPVKALIAALNDNDNLVKCSALWSLGQIGDADVVPFITPLLDFQDDTLRGNASESLDQLRDRGIID